MVKDIPATEILKRIHIDRVRGLVFYKSEIDGAEYVVGSIAPSRQTSPEVSSIAARMVRLTDSQMYNEVVENQIDFFGKVRSLAASALSQDETRGQ